MTNQSWDKPYTPKRSDKRNAIYTDSMGEETYKNNPIQYEYNSNPVGNDTLNRLITAYNNRMFGTGAPLIAGGVIAPDDASGMYERSYALRAQNGDDRLGFVGKSVSPTQTSYTLGIDNLPFGTGTFDKDITTPVGNFNVAYDGDSTGTLSYESSPNLYYLQALAKALMSKGSL